MSTLLIRLTGPMQSWGLQSAFSDRDTAREPTKSGVVGLLCAALGKPRIERPGDGYPTLAELAALRMGVRVDREGQPRYDFHTAQDVLKASATPGQIAKGSTAALKDTEPSVRHYLADAWFTVGLEGERSLLERIDAALAAPRWPLSLGRKAFPPGLPVRIVLNDQQPALFDTSLVESLASFSDPSITFPHLAVLVESAPETWRVVVDAEAVTAQVRPIARRTQPDLPLSFSPRRFAPREVLEGTLPRSLSRVAR
ncbi:MAG: type I-E CRISPR-associated protein Cas5/CasD [Bacteroidota bacterium]